MQKNNKKELLENIYGIWNCSVERRLLMYWLKLDEMENKNYYGKQEKTSINNK